MFTGIIETTGKILSVSAQGTNKTFLISAVLANELKVDQSLSHDGVCLTIEAVYPAQYQVTAIDETRSVTNLGSWKENSIVNLERCLQLNGRLDGHMVQGHVDATGICKLIKDLDGSWLFRFEFPVSFRNLIIEKGSVAVNGISLTCFDVSDNEFSVGIIPYTYEHTNIRNLQPSDLVNIEFDLIGKYVARSLKTS